MFASLSIAARRRHPLSDMTLAFWKAKLFSKSSVGSLDVSVYHSLSRMALAIRLQTHSWLFVLVFAQ